MPDLTGKKILFILAPEKFRDEEFFQPKEILESKGVQVTVASKVAGEITGMLGAKVNADLELGRVNIEDYDVVVFVGGSGAGKYFNYPIALQLAKNAVSMGKILGAICIAPTILANAGVLLNKKATAFPSETNNIRKKGAVVTNLPVVKDGRIITAQGPHAARAFGEEIIKALTFG